MVVGLSHVPALELFEPKNNGVTDRLLKDYYERFTGRHFETLTGRWDNPETSNVITAGDLAAVSCLSVSIVGRAAVRILETQAAEISELLASMPSSSVPIWEATDAELTDDASAATRLWKLLREAKDGMGQTTTSKLMARKRANLIPVYDSVIAKALGLRDSGNHWVLMRSLMRHEVGGVPLHDILARKVDALGKGDLVTPLRAFDVIVWYSSNKAPGTATLADKVRTASVAAKETTAAP